METVQASYIEQDCTIEHEGRKFTSGGAIVTDKFITAYLGKDGVLTDWHGKEIGVYRVLSSWPIRRRSRQMSTSNLKYWRRWLVRYLYLQLGMVR